VQFTLDAPTIDRLDLTGLGAVLSQLTPDRHARTLSFGFDYPLAEDDPRELSEIEEVRLWFIRADSQYPWLPYFLNWREGELTRYAAMLVPHRFDRKEGLIFNTEALQIFVFQKIFVVDAWLKSQNLQNDADLRYLAQSLGFDLEPAFFGLL